MQLTPAEIRFLMSGPNVEYGNGQLINGHFIDARDYGMPAAMFQRIVEDRALRNPGKLAEFRKRNSGETRTIETARPTADPKLVAEIEAERLF
jgi:hypothetical protein